MIYFLKILLNIIIFVIVSNPLCAMDPSVPQLSLLHLPKTALIKIATDKKLKAKDRKRLMHTCHLLHFMITPENLLKESIPLNLFNNVSWPLHTLETAVHNKNHACCSHIFNTEYNKISRFRKTVAYKMSRDKSFYKNRSLILFLQGLQFRITPSYGFIFDQKNRTYLKQYPQDPANLIPLFGEKKVLAELFQKCGYHDIAQNYIQAKNMLDLINGSIIARKKNVGIVYPPNILGHACLFGNVPLLKEILGQCKSFMDLLMYSSYPNAALTLAAEYNNPECFKLLYETPWLRKFFKPVYSVFLKGFCNYLETFILYYHDKKIIETLLQTGCFNINETMHHFYIKKDTGEYIVSNKRFRGKTLLDIILQEKKNRIKKFIRHKNLEYSIDLYCEEIAQLLRKYGGKTAQEIAAIHPFNEYLNKDIQQYILNKTSFFEQQKNRLVCSEWEKLIDNNPAISQSQWGLKLLRNPNPEHSYGRSAIRVLLGAIYKQDHSLIKIILQKFRQKNLLYNNYFMCYNSIKYRFVYGFSDFIQNPTTVKLIEKYHTYSLIIAPIVPVFFPDLIAASFMNDTKELYRIFSFFRQELLKPESSFVQQNNDLSLNFNDPTRKLLQNSWLIMVDYDYKEGMAVVVDIFKDTDFFNAFFNDLVLAAYILKSLKVLELLLSSRMDINKPDDKNQTIKDIIINERKSLTDVPYAFHVKALLDKYGAKTYQEIEQSYNKNP